MVIAVQATLLRPGRRSASLKKNAAIILVLAAIDRPTRFEGLNLNVPHSPRGGGISRIAQQCDFARGSNPCAVKCNTVRSNRWGDDARLYGHFEFCGVWLDGYGHKLADAFPNFLNTHGPSPGGLSWDFLMNFYNHDACMFQSDESKGNS